jgi:hypothetical protein
MLPVILFQHVWRGKRIEWWTSAQNLLQITAYLFSTTTFFLRLWSINRKKTTRINTMKYSLRFQINWSFFHKFFLFDFLVLLILHSSKKTGLVEKIYTFICNKFGLKSTMELYVSLSLRLGIILLGAWWYLWGLDIINWLSKFSAAFYVVPLL